MALGFLTLQSYSLTQADGLSSAQNSAPFSGSIGDKKVLTLDYSYTSKLDGMKLYFAPGMFLQPGADFQLSAPPSAAFYFEVQRQTAVNIFIPGVFIGNQTQKNLSARFKVSTDKKTLTVELTFILTADIDAYISNSALINYDRLLKDSFQNVGILTDNDPESVYSIQKDFGLQIYAEKQRSDFLINVNTGTTSVYIKRTDGGDFTQEFSTTSSGDVVLSESSTLIFVDADIVGVTASELTISASSFFNTIPDTGGYVAADTLSIQSAANEINETLSSTESEARTSYTRLATALDFYSEGEFTLKRNSEQVDNISIEVNTDLEVQVEFAHSNVACRLLPIRVNDIGNKSNFMLDYEAVYRTPDSIDAPSGNTKIASFTLTPAMFKNGGLYRLIAIFYNITGTETASFISKEFSINAIPEVLAVPNITSKIRDFLAEYTTNALQVAPLERFQLRLEIDKASYDTTLGQGNQGGDFDANFLGVEVNYQGNKVFAYKDASGALVPSNPNTFKVVSDGASTLVLSFEHRAFDDYVGQDIDFKWALLFSSEPKRIFYSQKIRVRSYENDAVTPEIEDAILKDIVSDARIFNFYEQDGFVRFEATMKSGSGATHIIAAIENAGRVLEERSFTVNPIMIFAQATNAIENVQAVIDGNLKGRYDFSTGVINENSIIAIIVKTVGDVSTLEGVDYWTLESDFVVK